MNIYDTWKYSENFEGKKDFVTVILGNLDLNTPQPDGNSFLRLFNKFNCLNLVICGADPVNRTSYSYHTNSALFNALQETSFRLQNLIWVGDDILHRLNARLLKSLPGLTIKNEHFIDGKNHRILVVPSNRFPKRSSNPESRHKFPKFLQRFRQFQNSSRTVARRGTAPVWQNTDAENIREAAVKLARSRGADLIICTQDRPAEYSIFPGVRYINPGYANRSGSYFVGLTENRLHFVSLNEEKPQAV